MTSADCVLSEQRDGALILTLSNPGRRNAFFPEMRERLTQCIRAAAHDASVRCVILTGADGHFCAGADLRRAAEADPSPLAVRQRVRTLHDLVLAIVSGPKPVIAAVEGDAFGAGLSLAVAADFVVCGRGARLGATFAKIGLLPDMGLLHTLPARVGPARARRLMLTGAVIDAEAAASIGMIDELASQGEALARSLQIAQDLAASAPLAQAMIKSTMAGDLDQLLARELDIVPLLASSEDHKAAVAAFFNKSQTTFRGR